MRTTVWHAGTEKTTPLVKRKNHKKPEGLNPSEQHRFLAFCALGVSKPV
jgi:hypothetical protein